MRLTLPCAAVSGLLIATAALAVAPAHPRAPAATHAAAKAAHRTVRTAPGAPDLDADTLAWVGDRAITALDLVQRIEWMPWPGKHGAASMDSVKVRALRALVAEALLAQESERADHGTRSGPARTRESLRRALARDALYRDLAAAGPPPSAEEVTALARRMHPEARAAQLPAWRHAAEDSLRELTGERRASEFLVAHLAGRRVEVDSSAFTLLADSLRAYMAAGHAERAQSGGLVAPSEASDRLSAVLSARLGETFARLPDGPLTLGDAIEDMRFYLFAFHSLRPGRFDADLGAQFRLVVQGELMGREALRRHMDQQPGARHDLRAWSDAWRARSVLDTLAATAPAGDDDAFQAFARFDRQRAAEVCDVDVEEVLCATPGEAEAVRAALLAGAPFDSLARARSRRTEWAAHGGRSGFFAVNEHPALGLAALLSPLDTLLGPLRLPEGSSVARARAKRLRPDSLAARAELERARALATGERRSDRIARHVGALAGGVRIRMADAALRRVDILESDMVVRRTLGFGGGMTAAPALPPIWEWTRYWRGTIAPLP